MEDKGERADLLRELYDHQLSGLHIPYATMDTDINELRFHCKRLELEIQAEREKQELENMKIVTHSALSTFTARFIKHPDAIEFTKSVSDGLDDLKSEYFDYGNKAIGVLFFSALTNYMGVRGGIKFRWDSEKRNPKYGIVWCFICRERFRQDDLCREPDCEHVFHAKCICALERKDSLLHCPFCNTPIVDKIEIPSPTELVQYGMSSTDEKK